MRTMAELADGSRTRMASWCGQSELVRSHTTGLSNTFSLIHVCKRKTHGGWDQEVRHAKSLLFFG